jgi:hypothetical protein
MADTNEYEHWPDHWKVKLSGYGDGDVGDVVTRDGEIIGIWTADENDHCSFTPNGHDEPILFNVFLGLLCSDIARWHEKTEAEAAMLTAST